MRYQSMPYIWPLLASAFTLLSLGIFALVKRRNAKGAGSFILSMIVLTIWSAANALEMSGADFSTKLFWANVQYFAYCYSPVTLLALCMEFTGFDRWVQNRKIVWFAVLPTIIILLVWTDRAHGLIRYNMHMDYSGLFPVIAKEYGPVFYIHAIYSHSLNIFAWVLLMKSVFFRNSVYRKQALSLLLGMSLIILPNILYISGLIPLYQFDSTPLFFGPAGLVAAWGIFRYKLFDVIPVAWATVIRIMDAGVMVLDMRDRVLDINPAFEKIIGRTASMVSAKQIEEVCGGIPELKKACKDGNMAHTEFSIHTKHSTKIFEAFFSPLADKKDMPIGRLVVCYEITEKKQAQQELLKQQWKFAVNEERERMARDLHDNLGQVLGFINLQAQGIQQELMNAGIETVSDKLDKLVDVTQSAHNEIREYIRGIRNPAYIEKDFITALEKDVSSLEDQTDLSIQLDIPNGFSGERIKPNIRINILSVIKEALNNVAKHAQAEHVRISLSLEGGQFYAVVEDDGKGFETIQNPNVVKTKFGLDIMRERAVEMGGKLEIESAWGKGSRIMLYVPIEKGDEKNEIDAGR